MASPVYVHCLSLRVKGPHGSEKLLESNLLARKRGNPVMFLPPNSHWAQTPVSGYLVFDCELQTVTTVVIGVTPLTFGSHIKRFPFVPYRVTGSFAPVCHFPCGFSIFQDDEYVLVY